MLSWKGIVESLLAFVVTVGVAACIVGTFGACGFTLIPVVEGIAVGADIGAGAYLMSAARRQHFSWRAFAAATIGGAVAGGVSGALAEVVGLSSELPLAQQASLLSVTIAGGIGGAVGVVAGAFVCGRFARPTEIGFGTGFGALGSAVSEDGGLGGSLGASLERQGASFIVNVASGSNC
jgi:hypothetical protein